MQPLTRSDACPFDRQREDHDHLCMSCSHSLFVHSAVEHTYGKVSDASGSQVPVVSLWRSSPLLLLTTTQGLMSLSGLLTFWSLRCRYVFQQQPVTQFDLVAAWVAKLELWLLHPSPTVPRSDVRPLHSNLKKWMEQRVLGNRWHNPKGPRPVLSLPPQARQELKQAKYAAHVATTMERLERLQGDGVAIAFTDGSSKQVRGWDQAGSGVFYGEGDSRNHSAPVPQCELQSNNCGELKAVLHVLQNLPQGGRVATVMDSEYVFLGPTERLLRRERASWKIEHADLWMLVLDLLRSHQQNTTFFWVPSHVGLEGNDGADREAENGRLQHPHNFEPSVKRVRVGRGEREHTPVPAENSWVFSEVEADLTRELSVLTVSDGEEASDHSVYAVSGSGESCTTDSGDDSPVDEYEAVLSQFLVLSPRRRKGAA